MSNEPKLSPRNRSARSRLLQSLDWSLIALWASLYVVTYASPPGVFGIEALILMALLWGCFIGILVYAVVRVVTDMAVPFLCVLILTGLFMGWWGRNHGRRTGILIRFHAASPRYERVVADVLAGRDPGQETSYIVDGGPPVRVAFPLPGGILDNWCGVVYDPTGLVLKARRFKPDLSDLHDPGMADVSSLFGGDLCYCEPLGGDWYFCCFT
jgi:hypothetical protein